MSVRQYIEFRRFSHRTAIAVGSSAAFATALATVAIWAIVGPIFHYSDTWQLTINTETMNKFSPSGSFRRCGESA